MNDLTNYKLKDIPGYEGRYQASECGKIYSLIRNKFLSPSLVRGYLTVGIKSGPSCKFKVMPVHRLVAFTFVEGYTKGFTVNHINMNKLDNSVHNLEWMDGVENSKLAHKLKAGSPTHARVTSSKRMSKEQVRELRDRSEREKIVISDESKRLGFTRQAIRYALSGKSYSGI